MDIDLVTHVDEVRANTETLTASSAIYQHNLAQQLSALRKNAGPGTEAIRLVAETQMDMILQMAESLAEYLPEEEDPDSSFSMPEVG